MDEKVEQMKGSVMGWVYLGLVVFVGVNCVALWGVGWLVRRRDSEYQMPEE